MRRWCAQYEATHGTPPSREQAMLPLLVAGHSFSEDLATWHTSPRPPFYANITFRSGRRQYFSTLERPLCMWAGADQ